MLIGLALTVGGTVLALGLLLWWLQWMLVYPGAVQVTNLTLAPPPGVERWTLDIGGGRSGHAFYIAPRGPRNGATTPGPAVVFLHGNGEFAAHWPQEMLAYAEMGVAVLIPEYRGYHGAGGRPGEAPILRDLEAWAARLAARPEVDPDRLVFHGRSLGTGFAAQLVPRRRPAALVLGSSFTSLADAAHDLMGVPRWLVRDRLEVRGVLEHYGGPVLLLHGDDDRVTPAGHAAANAAAARAGGSDVTHVTYPDTGHNNMPRGHGRWEDIAAFLRRHALLPSAAAPGGPTPARPGAGP